MFSGLFEEIYSFPLSQYLAVVAYRGNEIFLPMHSDRNATYGADTSVFVMNDGAMTGLRFLRPGPGQQFLERIASCASLRRGNEASIPLLPHSDSEHPTSKARPLRSLRHHAL